MTHHTNYSAEADAKVLSLLFSGASNAEIAAATGRSVQSIENRLQRLREDMTPDQIIAFNELRPARPFWSAEDDALLEANSKRPLDALETMFPTRSRKAIQRRLFSLGVRFGKKKTVEVEKVDRPYGVPYRTRSGVMAIRLASGVLPYIPSLYGDRFPPVPSP